MQGKASMNPMRLFTSLPEKTYKMTSFSKKK